MVIMVSKNGKKNNYYYITHKQIKASEHCRKKYKGGNEVLKLQRKCKEFTSLGKIPALRKLAL